MNKRSWLLIVGSFIFLYILNYLMPMAFGDDYLYAFMWQGNPMYVPLTEDAVKVSSFRDLLTSQISFYYTWSGRVVNNTLSQLFVWAGKDVFNIFNALASVLLVLEIYWCANKGRVTFNFDIGRLAWLFLFFWLFTPSFPSVVFWLVGACHYLWPAVFLTGFIVPFIQKYYFLETKENNNIWPNACMFFWGAIAGCTNENSVCWIIFLLLIFILKIRKLQAMESWMYFGVAGLILGYAVLMLSPGNYARLIATHDSNWFNLITIRENALAFARTLVYQFLLWYFCLRSLPQIYNRLQMSEETEKEKIKKELVLIKALCITAMGMSAIMLFSPEYHERSAFPGTVHLIIVTGIILRVQTEYGIELLQQSAKMFLACVGVVGFIVSAGFTLRHLYNHHIYNEDLLSQVAALKENGNESQVILEVAPFPEPDKVENFLSGYHTFDINASKEVNSWTNVSFARYYGLKGISVLDVDGKTASDKAQ